jgi:Xaa-Pro aminopeptidase
MNRLNALHVLMKEHGFDAYLITDSDAHYTFYSLLREDRRINWITQCQAQCGLALVTLNHNAFFQVPPNYRLLAKAEINEKIWLIVDDIVEWLCQHDPEVGTIGYDPRLTPLFVIQTFSKLNSNRCHLQPILSSINLIDAISNNETTPKRHTLTAIWSLDELRFAGQTSEDKVSKLRQNYLSDGEKKYTLITTAMDEIAWLLNLRGNDMQCNPLFYSFMIVSNDQLIVFTDNPHEVRNSFLL